MKRILTAFICFKVILWLGVPIRFIGAEKLIAFQPGAVQAQEDIPVYADVAQIFSQRYIV